LHLNEKKVSDRMKRKNNKKNISSDDESDIEFGSKSTKSIDVEFDFRDMSDDDYHGVKSLISQIATGNLANLTTLADSVCNQANVGCVVTTDGGESGVCAFGSILNINQYKEIDGMKSIRSLLKDIEKKSPKASKLVHNMLHNPTDFVTGLMIKERLINFPFELAPNIHKVLIDDVNWSSSSEYEPEKGETRDDYKFTHLLLLSSYEVESAGRFASRQAGNNENTGEPAEEEEAPMPPNMKKKRKMDKKAAESARIFLHWEDEVLVEKAMFTHAWQNTAKQTVVRAGRKYQSFNILSAIRWSDYVDLVDRISSA